MKKLSQNGDTIVEVLIAMAVVSMVIGGAFASANRSLNATQAAKERDQGVRLAESQIEQLKSAVKNPTIQTTLAGFNQFCLNAVAPVEITTAITLNVDSDAFNSSVYPATCTLNSGNTNYAATDASTPYYVSVTRSGADLYTTRVRWDRAGGNGREQVLITYRVYP